VNIWFFETEIKTMSKRGNKIGGAAWAAVCWAGLLASGAQAATTTYAIGGTVSGLITGQKPTLQATGTSITGVAKVANLTLSANGSFQFPATTWQVGSTYTVAVTTQPTGETCTVDSHATGTIGSADMSSVGVLCSINPNKVSGTLTGLAAGATAALQLNSGGALTVGSNGRFLLKGTVATGGTYFVAVLTQPSDATCVVGNGSGTMGTEPVTNVTVNCAAGPTGKLTDTGIKNTQCYQFDAYKGMADKLAGCTTEAALMISSTQDGMIGQDVARPGSSDGWAGMNYTKISATGAQLPVSTTAWDCVKDNITGLTWEVKTQDGGLRDMNSLYTQLGSGAVGDVGRYVQDVNAMGLCGHTDWRVPSPTELQSLIVYGQSMKNSMPKMDTKFFPDAYWSPTQIRLYWSSALFVQGYPYQEAWWVRLDGAVYHALRSELYAVRLVRP